MATESQLAANRANAQLSTGPKTEGGKAKASLNAVKTGLTGQTVLLPTDDAAVYQAHVDRYFAEFTPVTPREKDLTQSLADTTWRLYRIPALEAGVYARGYRQFAAQFESEPAPTRAALIQTETYFAYRREFSNLHLQESRLRKQFNTDREELTKLINDRQRLRQSALANCLSLFTSAVAANKPFYPAEFGFEFTTEEIKQAYERVAKLTRLRNGEYYGTEPRKAA